jgi:hypothetical protein
MRLAAGVLPGTHLSKVTKDLQAQSALARLPSGGEYWLSYNGSRWVE